MADKPERLDARYTLWEKIASGGMADVYRATEYGAKGSSKTVALKKILSSFSSNPDYKKMFIDEGIIGSQLTHANICQVNPLIEIGDNLYIPMEFIEGKNLRQVINKYKKKNGVKPLPLPFTLFIMNEVFKGLDYAHSACSNMGGESAKPLNIVHRDMSPQNIMLSYQGGVKLIDFGIAKAKILTNETRAGVIKGKYSYMSPEQALGQNLGPQSDIFSTAIVFWEMLTGERLFQSENDMATLKAIQDCDLKNLEPIKKNPEVSPELNRIVMKALTKDLSLRYKSADLIQQHIQKYINERFGTYSAKNARKFLEALFAEEIVAEQKRARELFTATLPNSQQKFPNPARENRSVENSSLDQALDGSLTSTEISQSIGVTQTDASIPKEELGFEDGLESNQNNQVDPTVLEVSQKTSVSLDQEKFKVPTIFGEDKPVPTKLESSITKAGNGEKSEIKLDVSAEEMEQYKKRDTFSSVNVQSTPSTKESGLHASMPSSESSATASKSVNIKLDYNASETPDTEPQTNGSRFESREAPKQGSRMVAYASVVLVVAVAYVYKLIFTGDVFPTPTRPPAASNMSSVLSTPSNKVEGNRNSQPLCQVQVDTDPPGANLVGDNFTGSSATGTISAPCGQAVVIRVEKPGFETVRLPVDTATKVRQTLPRVNLQPLKEGSIILTVDNNSKVEIDGRFVGEAKANVPTEYRLAPGLRKFTFKNEVLGIQAVKEFQIMDKEKRLENQIIRLTDIKP